jgi:peroxiredoxin
MNKKVIKYTLLSGLVLGLLCLGYGIMRKIRTKNAISERTAQLPSFQFERLDGTPITSKFFQNKPVWLLHFDSGCEFCQIQLSEIQQHSDQLSHIKVLLISSENAAVLKSFSQKQGFDKLPNITIVRDSTHVCTKLLGMVSTPSSLLYAADGRLVKRYNGVVKIEAVVKAFDNEQ